MKVTKEEVRAILYAYPLNAILSPDHEKIVLGILQDHPNAIEKVDVGVQCIFVKDGSYGTRCFWLHRIDGTYVDFSFLACFDKPRDDFPKAARRAVEPSIKEFRDTLPETFNCPILGIPLTPTTCHIDHVAPLTFKQIIKLFRGHRTEDIIEYDHSGIGVCFSDKDLEKEFIKFHDVIAVLRGISKKANLSLPKK